MKTLRFFQMNVKAFVVTLLTTLALTLSCTKEDHLTPNVPDDETVAGGTTVPYSVVVSNGTGTRAGIDGDGVAVVVLGFVGFNEGCSAVGAELEFFSYFHCAFGWLDKFRVEICPLVGNGIVFLEDDAGVSLSPLLVVFGLTVGEETL